MIKYRGRRTFYADHGSSTSKANQFDYFQPATCRMRLESTIYFAGNTHLQKGAAFRSHIDSNTTTTTTPLIGDFHSKTTIKHRSVGLGHRNVVITLCTLARLLRYRARHIVRHRVDCFYSGVYLTPYLQHSILRIHLRVHC